MATNTNKETENIRTDGPISEEAACDIEDDVAKTAEQGDVDPAMEELADEAAENGQEGASEEAPADQPEEEESLKDQYLRLMADFQNYKRRVEKERSDVHAFANEKIVTDLLEVMDNFERALEHDEGDGYKEGIALIFGQLRTVLENAGVEEIAAEDALFDPNLHNAVLMEETDRVESGNVSEVLQKGYTLHGKVIRPSMVKVAK